MTAEIADLGSAPVEPVLKGAGGPSASGTRLSEGQLGRPAARAWREVAGQEANAGNLP